jgi:2-C-methyl-D-erythritol 4-phosphate cytidylyltransferase
MNFTAIIPAGGKGLRSGLDIPKQFFMVNGRELISYSIDLFQKNRNIKNIIISAPEEYFPLLENCRIKYGFSKISHLVKGGNQRQDSVYNALISQSFGKDDFIVVHDAARPLLTDKLLNDVIECASRSGNGVLAVKARDTLAKGESVIADYVQREQIYYIQTPQVFSYIQLKDAFDEAYKDNFYATDESMLIHRRGIKVNLVEGSYLNFKVTTPEDILLVEKLI